jgi:hypothetical protein
MAIEPPEPQPSVLAALTNYQGAYHNHKEQLGYAAAALYVSGAVVLFFASGRWSGYPPLAKWLFLALLAVTGIAGWFYVYQQFRLRSMSADQIEQFLNLLGRERYQIEASSGCFRRWATPGTVLLVMSLWGAAALVRVVHGLWR